MSEPVTTWRPLNAFDANEQRIGGSEAAHDDLGEALAEILRRAGDPGKSATDHEIAAEDGARDWAAEAPAQEPLIRGDFAAIEAALLGAARPGARASADSELHEAPSWARLDLRASRTDADAQAPGFPLLSLEGRDGPDAPQHAAPLLSAAPDAAFYPDASAPSDHFMLFDDAAVSGSAALDEEDKRSRRPIYLMAALVLAGVAGMTATSFRRDGAGPIAPEATKAAVTAPFAAESVSSSPTTPNGADAAQQAPVQQASAGPDSRLPRRRRGPTPGRASSRSASRPLRARPHRTKQLRLRLPRLRRRALRFRSQRFPPCLPRRAKWRPRAFSPRRCPARRKCWPRPPSRRRWTRRGR